MTSYDSAETEVPNYSTYVDFKIDSGSYKKLKPM